MTDEHIIQIPTAQPAKVVERASDFDAVAAARTESYKNAKEELKARAVAVTIGPTLTVVIMFFFSVVVKQDTVLVRAVEFTLSFWVSLAIVFFLVEPWLRSAEDGKVGLEKAMAKLWLDEKMAFQFDPENPEAADINKDGWIGEPGTGIRVDDYDVTDFRHTLAGQPPTMAATSSDAKGVITMMQLEARLGKPFPVKKGIGGTLTLGQVLDFWDQSMEAKTFARDNFWCESGRSRYIGSNGTQELKVTRISVYQPIINAFLELKIIWEDNKGTRHPRMRSRNAVAALLLQYTYAERKETVINL